MEDKIKIYEPTVIEDTPFPGEELESEATKESSGGIYSPTEIKDTPLPRKIIAHETIGAALNTKSRKILAEFEFTEHGAIQIGKYTNGVSGDLRFTPNGLTARDKAGITTFAIDGETGDAVFKGTIQAGSVIAAEVDASLIVADSLSSISANLGTVTAGSMAGVSISIGSENNIFKADENGIYLGNATFASAPFRVSMAGAVTASSLTLTNASIGSGSSWTGNQIANAYIGNLSATKITSDYLSADRIEGGSITASKLNVSQLSAISANLGTITSGSITGATVQTASSGQRVVLDSNNQVRLYTASKGPGIIYGDTDSIVFANTAAIGVSGDVVCNNLALGATGSEGSIDNINWLYGENDLQLRVIGQNKMLFESTTNDSGEDNLSFYPHWGDFYATGTKFFRIRHPDHPDEGWIQYVSVESPEVALKIRGIAQLNNGEAIITLPRHWELVTEEYLNTVQLTPLGDCKGLFAPKSSLKNTSFTVKELQGGQSDVEFAWELTATRKGYASFNPEQTVKEEIEKHAQALVDTPNETKKEFLARQQARQDRRKAFREAVLIRYKEITRKEYVDKPKQWLREEQEGRLKFEKTLKSGGGEPGNER